MMNQLLFPPPIKITSHSLTQLETLLPGVQAQAITQLPFLTAPMSPRTATMALINRTRMKLMVLWTERTMEQSFSMIQEVNTS